MERRVAHQHVDKPDKLVKVVASGLDESLAVERIRPHGLNNLVNVASVVELVKELAVATCSFNIDEEADERGHQMCGRQRVHTKAVEQRSPSVVPCGVQTIGECLA